MSLMTPILTTPSVYCAKAELLARSAAITIMLRVIFIFFLHVGPAALRFTAPVPRKRGGDSRVRSDAEIFVQLIPVGVQFRLGKAFGHAAMLHDIVAVRDRRGEMEILLD